MSALQHPTHTSYLLALHLSVLGDHDTIREQNGLYFSLAVTVDRIHTRVKIHICAIRDEANPPMDTFLGSAYYQNLWSNIFYEWYAAVDSSCEPGKWKKSVDCSLRPQSAAGKHISYYHTSCHGSQKTSILPTILCFELCDCPLLLETLICHNNNDALPFTAPSVEDSGTLMQRVLAAPRLETAPAFLNDCTMYRLFWHFHHIFTVWKCLFPHSSCRTNAIGRCPYVWHSGFVAVTEKWP